MATETTETTTSAPVAATGVASIDDRIAAAAEALGEVEGDAPTEPAPESEKPQETPAEGEGEQEQADASESDEEKPKAAKEPKEKQRNMVRDLAAEWATARRYQQQNAKRAAELEARSADLERQAQDAREIALLMQGHPIKAAERLAAIAGISTPEYLQRLQLAFINGEQEQPKQQETAIAKELAELRAELHAERNRRVQEEQARIYAEQVAQITQSETTTLVELAKQYSEHFPALQNLNDKALQTRIADAVQFYVGRGDEVGRFEVLQAVNNIVQDTLAEYGLADSIGSRVASAPAAKAEKRTANQAMSRPRNGSGRYIPTNAVAADAGGARRAMTAEERLAAAAKVL